MKNNSAPDPSRERLVSAAPAGDDSSFELKLRPQRLAEFIGQKKVKENLAVAIEAARSRGEAMDHVLLYGPPGLGKTTLAAIILARRNMKGARMDAALSHLERYLAARESGEAADGMLFERAKRVATPLALKTAAQRVKEGRYDEARDLLLRTLASVADQDGTADVRARLNEFVQALQERATYPQRVERLAAGYEAMPVESVLEKEDLEAAAIEIPIVLPPKSQRALDQIGRPVFDATQWRAGTYPELLLAFDC